jgi:hypothetical protein
VKGILLSIFKKSIFYNIAINEHLGNFRDLIPQGYHYYRPQFKELELDSPMHLLLGFMAVRACPAVVPHQTQAETLILIRHLQGP